ncbi:MAG TPA: Rid family hydrolase [Candidatus Acidoferrales bacterium]|nr:Rid family hydrolase [Candidatus Acidoferrales bacterium]
MKLISVLLGVILLSQTLGQAPANDRKYIVLPRESSAITAAPFSEAVLAGDTLYVAGHVGLDPKTGKPGVTAEEEARLAMDSVKHTIEAAGMAMDDLVSVQVFCSDVTFYGDFNNVYRTYFHGNFPARAFVGSGKLLLGARYEVMGIAVKRDGAGVHLVK